MTTMPCRTKALLVLVVSSIILYQQFRAFHQITASSSGAVTPSVATTATAVKKRTNCRIEFRDHNMILCQYSSSDNSTTVDLQHSLEHHFDGCTAAHIGVFNLTNYPELRFNRSCFFNNDSTPIHRLGDRPASGGGTDDTATTTHVMNYDIHCQTQATGNNTLVILIGKLRGGEQVWETIHRHVLDFNQADLMLFHIGPLSGKNNSLIQRAKFVAEIPFYNDWTDAINILARGNSSYQKILNEIIPSDSISLGGALGYKNGSGALVASAKWMLSEYIRDYRLTELYDRFVIDRSDHYYHCALDLSSLTERGVVYVPSHSDWNGICDRHAVASADMVHQVLEILPPLVRNPERYRHYQKWPFNSEELLKMRWNEDGLKVKRSPRTMFVAARDEDASLYTTALSDKIPEGVGLRIKYREEYDASRRYCMLSEKKNTTLPSSEIYRQHSPIGMLQQVSNEISGWACDLDFPDLALVVELEISGKTTIKLTADGKGGKTMQAACGNTKMHRFQYLILNGTNGNVRAFVLDPADPSQRVELEGSNQVIV